MAVDDSVLALIETIYDAAIDETLWPDVLRRMIAITDSQAASFYTLDSADELRLPIFEYINFDRSRMGEYLARMALYDPTNQYIVAHPSERIVHDSTFISEAEKDRHVYYDWHGRFSDTRHRIVGVVSPMPHLQSGIALHRTRRKGDFEPETIRHFSVLFRHIERALEIGARLGTLGRLQQVSLELLDRNPLAIVLLDGEGRVVLANRAARLLGEAGEGVALASSGITLRRSIDNQKLRRLIREVLQMARGAGPLSGGAMLAARPAGRRPLSLLVSPLSPSAFALTRLRPCACVVIADPEKAELVPVERLRALYGLTHAEAKLAARLAAGEELQAAALALGVAYATARSQLAAIFRKTETRRQGELVALLLRTVPLLVA